jgi:hypothetical protein
MNKLSFSRWENEQQLKPQAIWLRDTQDGGV